MLRGATYVAMKAAIVRSAQRVVRMHYMYHVWSPLLRELRVAKALPEKRVA